MKRLFLLAVLALGLSGCGQPPPTLAGGKPVSYWVHALHDPDVKVRKTAVFKLGNVGPTDATVFPALLAALKDRDAGVRRETVLALMKFGSGAREAIPVLTDLRQHDRDAGVRGYAAKALQRFERDTDPAP